MYAKDGTIFHKRRKQAAERNSYRNGRPVGEEEPVVESGDSPGGKHGNQI